MKKIVSFLLVLSMIWAISATAFAQQKQDPNNIVGHYVEELVIMSDEELASLSLVEASLLFEKAFHVSSNSYSEDEIRMGISGLSFGLKFQSAMFCLEQRKKKIYTLPAEFSQPQVVNTTLEKLVLLGLVTHLQIVLR